MACVLMQIVEDSMNLGQPTDQILQKFNDLYASVHYPPIDYFRTLLMCSAVNCGRIDVLNRLLELGYNVNYTFDNSSETPLHLAVLNENEIMIDRLLQAGASVYIESRVRGHSVNNEMRTPMEMACAKSNTSILGRLIKDYDRNKTRRQFTPLHMACRQRSLECLQYLLNDETARQYAGHIDDVDCDDRHYPDGFTALMMAARNGSELTRELLLHGASVAKTTARTRSTALHEAVKSCGSWTMGFIAADAAATVRLLVDAGSDVNALDSSRYTPLALLTSQIPSLMRGVSCHAYPYDIDSHRLAVIEAAELLLQSGANPNVSYANPLELVVRYLSSVCSVMTQMRYPTTAAVPPNSESYDRTVHLESARAALNLGSGFIEVLLKYGASLVPGCGTGENRRDDQKYSFILFTDFVSLMKIKTNMAEHKKLWILLTESLLDILRLFSLAGDGFRDVGISVAVGVGSNAATIRFARKISLDRITRLRAVIRGETNLDELQTHLNSPLCLTTLCGAAIASSMGIRCLNGNDVAKLGLPSSLHKFILGL